ncbi:hypothetical protein [Halomicrococcus sp. SG-WS-1]|uniref:hypothetical protein n=1 Tax=Halomicrococcus sp. SG-WS-1 TaxID=3439057 RepID=UPI003F796C7C
MAIFPIAVFGIGSRNWLNHVDVWNKTPLSTATRSSNYQAKVIDFVLTASQQHDVVSVGVLPTAGIDWLTSDLLTGRMSDLPPRKDGLTS